MVSDDAYFATNFMHFCALVHQETATAFKQKMETYVVDCTRVNALFYALRKSTKILMP